MKSVMKSLMFHVPRTHSTMLRVASCRTKKYGGAVISTPLAVVSASDWQSSQPQFVYRMASAARCAWSRKACL